MNFEDFWEPFGSRFGFPLTREFQEPAPPVTFDLSPIFTGSPSEYEAGKNAINALTVLAITRIAPPAGRMLILDWQHPSHWYWPHKQHDWQEVLCPVLPFPDGDYHAYLTEDMTTGTFGHPWEQTLCVFGGQLIDALHPMLAAWLPVKRSTVTQGASRQKRQKPQLGEQDEPDETS